MENQELLQTMRDIIKEEMAANNANLRQEMSQLIDEKLAGQDKRIDEKLAGQEKRINGKLDLIIEDLEEIKDYAEETRNVVNTLLAWTEEVSIITQIKFPVEMKNNKGVTTERLTRREQTDEAVSK